MSRQEPFLSIKKGDQTVEVLKTYDKTFAREVFENMDEEALAHLAASLNLDTEFDQQDIPTPTDESYEEFIWGAMLDSAREDYNTFSWFVVSRSSGRSSAELFVSPDWPTAEAYVKRIGISGTIPPSGP